MIARAQGSLAGQRCRSGPEYCSRLRRAEPLPIVASMKRLLPFVLCLFASRLIWMCAADQLADATALAAQRDAEERLKRLSADVQTVLDTQELIQKRQEEFRQKLEKLADDVRSLK